MAEASRILLKNALTLRSDAKIIHHPDRYVDERGAETWKMVTQELERLENL